MLVVNIQEEGRFGGPQKRIAEVAKESKSRGCITIPIFPKDESEKFQNLLKKYDVNFVTTQMHRVTRDKVHLIKYFIFFPFEIFALYKILRRINPDLTHCNGSFQIKGAIASKLAGIKCVWHMNDTMTLKPVYFIFNKLKGFLGDKFVAASKRSAEYYFPDNYDEIAILPAPVMTESFSPDAVRTIVEIDKMKGIKVVTVGNVNPIKGFDTFINAAVHINKVVDKDINFIIVGPLLENQKKLIEDLNEIIKSNNLINVHFLGRRDDIPSILKSCDIYVCSSRFEASPISVWEAMSMAKPIVATDVGDVKDIFEEYDCGLSVPVDNPQLMAESIISIIENPIRMAELGKKAREVAINHFDISACTKKHLDIYSDLINHN